MTLLGSAMVQEVGCPHLWRVACAVASFSSTLMASSVSSLVPLRFSVRGVQPTVITVCSMTVPRCGIESPYTNVPLFLAGVQHTTAPLEELCNRNVMLKVDLCVPMAPSPMCLASVATSRDWSVDP